MASRRRQIEQQIARTADPVIRAQLQNLLNGKGHRREKMITRIEEALASRTRRELAHLPASVPLVLILIVLTLLMLIIFLIVEGGT